MTLQQKKKPEFTFLLNSRKILSQHITNFNFYFQLFVPLAVKMEALALGLIFVHVLEASKEPNVRLTLMNVQIPNFINVPQIQFVSTNLDGK